MSYGVVVMRDEASEVFFQNYLVGFGRPSTIHQCSRLARKTVRLYQKHKRLAVTICYLYLSALLPFQSHPPFSNQS